jgi:hypothetical protein
MEYWMAAYLVLLMDLKMDDQWVAQSARKMVDLLTDTTELLTAEWLAPS